MRLCISLQSVFLEFLFLLYFYFMGVWVVNITKLYNNLTPFCQNLFLINYIHKLKDVKMNCTEFLSNAAYAFVMSQLCTFFFYRNQEQHKHNTVRHLDYIYINQVCKPIKIPRLHITCLKLKWITYSLNRPV